MRALDTGGGAAVTLSAAILARLAAIVGPEHLLIPGATATYDDYGRDQTEDLLFVPAAVVRPGTPEEVAAVLRLCHDESLPLTPRGAGTGLSGGALPQHRGLVLSTERFNRILEIDEANQQATVEPGVVNQAFQDAVMAKGLFYPPDPASKGSCFLGGNLSQSSGGPKAVKYGTTRDYVLNIQAVLVTGEIIWTGANTLKNATGYNLTQLLIGSEGTLAVITKIVFRLLPLPRHDLTLLVPFRSPEAACAAVAKVLQAGLTPSGLEFMERNAIVWSARYLNLPLALADDIAAHLLIELDGNDPAQLQAQAEQVYEVVSAFDVGEIEVADTAAEKERLWRIRRNIGNAVRYHSVYKEEDTVVPRAALPTLLAGVKEIGTRYGFQSVCYGHAGDGNLHINIIRGELSDDFWHEGIHAPISEIFRLCVSLGGTISGEHGIGLVQRPYIGIAVPEVQLELMRGIKRVFDPKGILNPGKIF